MGAAYWPDAPRPYRPYIEPDVQWPDRCRKPQIIKFESGVFLFFPSVADVRHRAGSHLTALRS